MKCVICGGEFIQSKRQVACSPSCAELRHRQTTQIWNKKHPDRKKELARQWTKKVQGDPELREQHRIAVKRHAQSPAGRAYHRKYQKEYYAKHKGNKK